jgi:flagellar basal-body rod protein FlgC
MGMFDAITAAGSALTAERMRMDVTAENLANAQTTRGADGQPYRRKEVILQERGGGPSFGSMLNASMNKGTPGATNRSAGNGGGVQVAGIAEDPTDFRMQYDPGHPDADQNGYVRMPNVNPVTEMVDLISASRGYEANVTAMNTAKQMFSKSLEILR